MGRTSHLPVRIALLAAIRENGATIRVLAGDGWDVPLFASGMLVVAESGG
jgi:hypothetical protein